MIDARAFGLELAGIVKAQLDPILTRLAALEKRVDSLPAPVDVTADIQALKAAVEGITIPEIPPVPELPDIEALVDVAVKDAVAIIPTPKDGKSVTAEDLAPLVASEVEKRISEIPRAKDGEPGRDGVGVAGAIIDRDGELVVTFSNGEVKKLGPVLGKDGEPGKPGLNGAGIEDLDVKLLPDGRTIEMSFQGKEYEYCVELSFPAMIYRGVHREGEYTKGDTVTWAGSLWHCDAEKTAEKPGDGSADWTLCAKKGRDGKDGILKDEKTAQPVRVGTPVRAS